MYENLQQDDADTVYVRDLIQALKKTGVLITSPILKESLEGFDEDDELPFETFAASLKKSTRLEAILRDQLVIPNFDEFAAVVSFSISIEISISVLKFWGLSPSSSTLAPPPCLWL